MKTARRLAALIGASSLALTLAACGSGTAENSESGSAETVSIETNDGTVEVPKNPKKVVALDNRSFQTLEDWDIKPVAAPRKIVPKSLELREDESVVDLGNHREPDLEAIVAAEPDVIITGQRFTQHTDKIKELAGDTPIVDLEPRDGKPLDEEFKRQTTALGEIFGKEKEADELVKKFEDAEKAAKDSYNKDQTVMGLISTGGNLNYSAPSQGRGAGPLFDMVGLKPALDVPDASEDHEGDDVSVEAIAKSNPDWIIVMDRDAAITMKDGEKYHPAKDVVSNSAALKNVTAIKEGHVLYMPEDTYVNESIQTYTEALENLAEEFGKQ